MCGTGEDSEITSNDVGLLTGSVLVKVGAPRTPRVVSVTALVVG